MNIFKKLFSAALAAFVFSSVTALPALSAQWVQDDLGWWYQLDDGSYPVNAWSWIEGKCYYFDGNGYCLMNTTTPDGCTVDASGAWTIGGVVQTQASSADNNSVSQADANAAGADRSNNTSGGKASAGIPASEAEYGEMVWIPTNGGTKYHSKSSCSKMISPNHVNINTAKNAGFTPCGRCY